MSGPWTFGAVASHRVMDSRVPLTWALSLGPRGTFWDGAPAAVDTTLFAPLTSVGAPRCLRGLTEKRQPSRLPTVPGSGRSLSSLLPSAANTIRHSSTHWLCHTSYQTLRKHVRHLCVGKLAKLIMSTVFAQRAYANSWASGVKLPNCFTSID